MIFGYAIGLATLGSSTGSPTAFSGEIIIEPDRWQLISVASRYGHWVTGRLVNDGTLATIKNYVIDQLVSRFGAGCVEVAAAYPGDLNGYLFYDPASTPSTDPGNFNLIRDVDGVAEVTAFWIKSLYGSDMNLLFTEWRD